MDTTFPCKNDLSFSRVIRAEEERERGKSDEEGEKRLGLILGLISIWVGLFFLVGLILNGYIMSDPSYK